MDFVTKILILQFFTRISVARISVARIFVFPFFWFSVTLNLCWRLFMLCSAFSWLFLPTVWAARGERGKVNLSTLKWSWLCS